MDPSYKNVSNGSGSSGGVGGSFGQPATMSPQPISSGTGDIVLSGGQKAGGKKWRIVLVILAVVAVIGGVVAMVMLTPGKQNVTSDGDLRSAFNLYANYLVSGQAVGTSLEGDYSENASYALDRTVMRMDLDYFRTADEYWADFLRIYENQDSVVVNGVEEQDDLMKFVTNYYGQVYLSDEDLLKMYVNNGTDTTKTWIREKYDALKAIGYNLASDFSDAMMNEKMAQVDLYDVYAQGGCIVQNGLNYECVDGLQVADETKARLIEASSSEDLDIIKQAIDLLLRNSWEISKELEDAE